ILRSVEPSFGGDETRSFSSPGGTTWSTPGINAVRARTGHEVSDPCARVLGFAGASLTKPAVAAVGSATSANCVKPWGVPMSGIAWLAGRADPYDPSPLTEAELAYLESLGEAGEIRFKNGGGSSGVAELVADGSSIPGNFGA